MNCELPIDTHKKYAAIFKQMGGSAVTDKPKPKKWQVGSGRDTNFSNNLNYSITKYPPCSNKNTPYETLYQ